MRSRKILWGLACLAAGTTLFAETAHADRRTGLGGNLLIQDPDDLFPFPQHALKHRNMIRLDYAPGETATGGNGVLTLGDERNAYGIALHRGDLLSPDVVGFNSELAWLGGVQNPFNSFAAPAFPAPGLDIANQPATVVLPATVVDLFYARALSASDSLGFRFGFGRGIQSQKVDDDVTKGSSTFIVGQLGYSRNPTQGFRMDLSGNIMGAFGKSKVGGEDNSKGFDLRVGGLFRGYYPLSSLVDIGVIGNLSVDNERVKDQSGPEVKSNNFGLGAMAGAGPAIHIDRAQIAAYGGFVLGAGKTKPDTDDGDSDTSRLSFAAPMVNMATEVQVLDWLFVRSAAQYTWRLDRFKGDDGTEVKERFSSAPFTWSVGLGMMKNNFYFDGVLRNAFVTNGPQFIGGNNPGFMAMASMTYKFGDVFNNANDFNSAQPGTVIPANERVPQAPVVEPVPAPEPEVVEPAVDQESGAVAPSVNSDVNATGTTTTGNGAVNTQGSAGGGFSIGR